MQREVAADLGTIPGVVAWVEGHERWLTDLQRWVSSCVKTLSNFGSQPHDAAAPAGSGEVNVMASMMARLEVATVMDWITNATKDEPDGPLVSITMATRNRPALLREALDSVFAQSYQNFELVVVDDSDGEETADFLGTIADHRLRVVRAPERRGAGAAFNIGLEHATGDIVTFLDDDNLMHPEWLRSAVWAFATFPEVQSLYGARVHRGPGGAARRPIRHAGDARVRGLRQGASRAGELHRPQHHRDALSGLHVRYDETLARAFDWDSLAPAVRARRATGASRLGELLPDRPPGPPQRHPRTAGVRTQGPVSDAHHEAPPRSMCTPPCTRSCPRPISARTSMP